MESLNLPSVLTPDFGLLFWMLISFLTVFVILCKYGFPVIVKMVDDRKAFIDESLTSAREANEKLANIKAQSDSILKEAREKQTEILKEAMATRDAIVKEARDKAIEEGQKMIAEAKAQINVERERAFAEVRSHVADLSIDIAGKLVRHQLDKNDEQEKYISALLDEVSAQNTK